MPLTLQKKELNDIWTWPHVFWINIFCWWAEEFENERIRRIAKKLRPLLFSLNVIFVCSLFLAIVVKAISGNIMASLFSIFATGPAVIGTVKTYMIWKHKSSLKKAMDILDSMMDDYLAKGVDPNIDADIRRRLSRCWLVFSLMLGFGSLITIHWFLRPLILAAYGIKTRIVDTWPELNETWPQFAVSYMFQSINVTIIGHSLYLFDNIYFCIAENILIQFKILNSRLEHLSFNKGTKGSVTIGMCIEQHNLLLSVCNILRDTSTYVIFLQCVWTVLIVCSGIFEITKMKTINANIILNILEISLVLLIILYLYCWYSNEITTQCGNLINAAYMGEWIEGKTSDKLNLLNLMTKTMKPVVYGGILEINLNTFINVVKTTFSYYNFLIAMSEE